MAFEAVDKINENQHWISRVLLDGFKLEGKPLQVYHVPTGKWVPKSMERTCASPGYNQLLSAGMLDNSLEAEFSKVESKLRKTFAVLHAATKSPRTELPRPIYENLCRYCAFLKLTSPVSKVGAVVDFVIQINHELETQRYHFLTELGIDDKVLRVWQQAVEKGCRVIVQGANILQLLYRFKIPRTYSRHFQDFLRTKWVISNSPMELPLSDVGLVPLYSYELKAMHYMLPLRPNVLLHGIFFSDLSKNVERPLISSVELSEAEALEFYDTLCASAIREVICSRQMPGIAEAIVRARNRGVSFNRIVDHPAIISAGLKDVGNGDLFYRVVSIEDYRNFVHSYVVPTS